MTVIHQIHKEINNRKDLTVTKVCDKAKVNYNTYYNALRSGNMKESTLIRLIDVIGKKIVLIDSEL